MMNDSMSIADKACEQLSFYQGSGKYWTNSETVSINHMSNFISLPNVPINSNEKSVFFEQCSPEWFDLKKSHPVAGSTLYDINGFDTLKLEQQKWYDYHKGVGHPPFPDNIIKALAHGVSNEPTAM